MGAFINNIVTALQDALKSDYLVTLIISMIPMIEVRGAIPIALSMGMKPFVAYFFSSVSALIICPILVLFLRPLLNVLKRTKLFKGLANSIEDKFRSKAKRIEDKAELKAEDEVKKKKNKLMLYKMIGLFIFVAIPLPMTGVWTGTAIAVFINMDLKQSILPIVIGNFVAGGIITIASVILGENSYIILIVLIGFIIFTILSLIISEIVKKKKKKNLKNPNAVIISDKE